MAGNLLPSYDEEGQGEREKVREGGSERKGRRREREQTRAPRGKN